MLCTLTDDAPFPAVRTDIQGRIRFTNDTAYWQANSFPFVFQNVTSFFKLGGEDVWIYGGTSSAKPISLGVCV